MSTLKITQTRSLIGQSKRHRDTIRTLGLRRINHTVTHTDSPSLEAQLRLVAHMVRVEPAGKE
jgi:large subunit ribosomal protein L30